MNRHVLLRVLITTFLLFIILLFSFDERKVEEDISIQSVESENDEVKFEFYDFLKQGGAWWNRSDTEEESENSS